MFVLWLLLVACACAPFGAWVASEKGRPWKQGALVSFLFGPFGVLIIALLPNREPTAKPPKRARVQGSNPRSRMTAWGIPDDWEPKLSPPEPPKRDQDEDDALRYLSGN